MTVPNSNISAYPLNIYEQAPVSLCDRAHYGAPDPNTDTTDQFLTSLVERHNTRFLFSNAWRCRSCDKPAQEPYHSAIPRLF